MAATIQAVIFDWAGTTVDYGCQAPALVFQRIFEQRGVPITVEQARGPMGMAKRDHLAAIAGLPEVAARWQTQHGRLPGEADVDQMYADFLPLQLEVLADHSEVLPGVVEVARELRARGIAIGSSTGYTQALMAGVAARAREQGFTPDVLVCSDDVAPGRPAPWMLLEAARRLNAFPVRHLVKVDDTQVGIDAGRNAGAWTVAVVKTGNRLGMTRAEVERLSPEQLDARLEPIRREFLAAGADYVIDGVADLLPVLSDIEQRLNA